MGASDYPRRADTRPGAIRSQIARAEWEEEAATKARKVGDWARARMHSNAARQARGLAEFMRRDHERRRLR